MAERSAEVLVCGASIMKDVWEIRLKDYRQKARLEDERLRRSALKKIDQDWQARMSNKIKTPKRLERKAKPPEQSSVRTFKVKQMNPSRPHGFQSSRLQRQADSKKTTKVKKPALLRHFNESCPGLMAWTKSWKFSKPSEDNKETCCVSDWGKSWKFLNLQPNTEGKHWFDLGFDNNNMSCDGILFLWEGPGTDLNHQHLHQEVSDPEWEKSWVFKQKREDTANVSCLPCNKFYNPCESHREDDSEWHHSWKSTKPLNEIIQSTSKKEDQKNDKGQPELPWNTSWMYFKKQLHVKCKTSADLGWSQSWSVSKTIAEQVKKSVCFQAIMPDDPSHFNVFNVIMSLSGKMKHTILKNSPLHQGNIHSPEWKKSWTTVKNPLEYKEETNKEENKKNSVEEPKKVPPVRTPECQNVKFHVLSLTETRKLNEIVSLQEQNKRETHSLIWKDSWKMLKHQRKEQRGLRNQRRLPLQLSATLQTSANSSKFTNLTLNQDVNLWQQGWSTYSQPRFNRRLRELDELNENVPYNGPLGVRCWEECWRSTRHLERQNESASTHPINPQVNTRSMMDWEQSWQSGFNQQRHDRPSMVEWMGSWRFSGHNLGDLRPNNTSMEIKVINSRTSTFKERCPSEPWNDSWRIKKRSGTWSRDLIAREVLDWDHSGMFTGTDFHQRHDDHYINFKFSSDVPTRMPKAFQIEGKSEWGRSWKISNPQPPKNIALWSNANPRPKDVLLWTRTKHTHLLPTLPKEPAKLNIWGTSWRFTKMESKQGFDSLADESLMNVKTKMRYTNIEQHKPQQKRWNDACKLSKTQPRPKRDTGHKSDQCEGGQGMFAQWIESWRFSKSHDWKNSWKFLLDPYVPLNRSQTIKGR